MTGNDILNIAIRELGVKESPKNSNRVKYNTWYYGKEVSGSAYLWCMAFVQWVFAQANAPLPLKTASCGALLNWYKEHAPDCLRSVSEAQAGDIVIFDFPGGAATDHCGILEHVGTDTVTTIDGNTGTGNNANGGAVMRRTRNLDTVRAIIHPKEIAEPKKQDYSADACAWAADVGLFLGTGAKLPDGSPDYAWDRVLTRRELALVLCRFAALCGVYKQE